MNRTVTLCMACRSVLSCLVLSLMLLASNIASVADDSAATPEMELVGKILSAAGGEEKLLTVFRMEERYNAGKERVSPGTSRVSVVEPPKYWWIGTSERGQEPAKITAWAWTLGVLKDSESELKLIPDMIDSEKELVGIQITGSVDPVLDMYFDKTTHELVRVDWRNDIYRFSDWKEYDGTKYPAKCAMFRRTSGEPWFFHEIVTVERLKELPEGLKR